MATLLFRVGRWIGRQYHIKLLNFKEMVNYCILKMILGEIYSTIFMYEYFIIVILAIKKRVRIADKFR